MISELISTAASIDWGGIIAAFMAVSTAISGAIAVLKNKEAATAKKETAAVQAFFDPTDNNAMVPPAGTPERSWKMSDSVKQFLLAGHTEPEKTSILRQIDEAEKAGLVDYKIVHNNGYYNISYGQISGGASGGK